MLRNNQGRWLLRLFRVMSWSWNKRPSRMTRALGGLEGN